MTTFTAAVRNRISDNFRDKSFCFFDFTDIAAQFGKQQKSVTHVLREMKEKQWLVDAGEKKHKGAARTKFYRVVPGVVFDVAPVKSSKKFMREKWEQEKSERDRHASECAKRLGDALNRMAA